MQDLEWKPRSCLKKPLDIHQKQTNSFAGNLGNIKEKMMSVPKPSAPKKKVSGSQKQQVRRKTVDKKEHTTHERMTHRPFAEALKDFFTKEKN